MINNKIGPKYRNAVVQMHIYHAYLYTRYIYIYISHSVTWIFFVIDDEEIETHLHRFLSQCQSLISRIQYKLNLKVE